MKIPRLSAAWITVAPSGASTCVPSIVRVGMEQPRFIHNASASPDVILELRAKLRNVGLDGPGRGVREYTNRLALHVAGHGKQVIEILKPSFSPGNALHDAMNPPGSLSARRALTAGLMGEALGGGAESLDRAG